MRALRGRGRRAGAVILRSGSERFFSAGADIKAFDANSVEDNMRMIRQAHEGLSEMARTPKVFIAQIGATALGGGLEMALACDLRFGAEGEYVLGLPEATLGLLPGNGGTQRLPRLIGVSKALDLMVTGTDGLALGGHELGILDRLFPEDALEEETRKYAEAGGRRDRGHRVIKLAVYGGIEGRWTKASRPSARSWSRCSTARTLEKASPRSWRSASRV